MTKTIDLLAAEVGYFRSYRKPQVIHFSRAAGLCYLTGKNAVEPRLGANGSGKSSLFEAVHWCLYGATSDGDKASDVRSWNSDQPPQVATQWLIDDKQRIVERIGSPNRLMIDGDAVEQKEVDRLIGLDRSRFQQAVMHGQFAKLFMELSVPDRGELLDQVLSSHDWLQLSEFAGKVASDLSKQADQFSNDLSRLQGQIDALSDIATLQKQAADWEDEREVDLQIAINSVAEAEQQEARLENELAALKRQQRTVGSSRDSNVAKLRRELENFVADIRQMETAKRQCEADADFYNHHKECPRCHQAIQEAFVKQQREELALRSAWLGADIAVIEAEVRAKRQALREAEEAFSAAEIKQERDRLALADVERHLLQIRRAVEQAVSHAEKVGSARNPYKEQIADQRARRDSLLASKRKLARQALNLRTEIEKATYWKNGFKLVRLFVIKRILTSLELEVIAAAASLGLIGWKVAFTTESETKSGSIKHGVQVQVQSPASKGIAAKWSGGESQRIKLAVNIGLSNLIQRSAGVKFGFEIWDEPTEHLSPEGIEDLMATLDYRAQTSGKQIWIADQTAPTYAGFQSVWQACKTAAGTSIIQLAGA